MHLNDIRLLYDFNYWAAKRILDVVTTISVEEFTKDRNSSHGGIRGTLVHAMGAEEIWLKRWKGEPITTVPREADFPTAQNLIEYWSSVERDIMHFCGSLRADEDIQRVFTYSDLKGNPYSSTLYEAMQHVVNHSTYHRGQVVTMFRQSGIRPVATDLIIFYRELRRGSP